MILGTQKKIFNIMASINANRFIYYFKRIPIIGKNMPDSIYGNLAIKRSVAVIATILKFFRGLFGKALILFLTTILPVLFIKNDASLRLDSFIHIFIVFNFLSSFITSSILESDFNRYVCIRLMRMEPRSYIVSTVLFRAITDFLCFLPLVILSSIFMGGSVLLGLLLTVVLAVSNVIGEVYFLLVYKKQA